MLNNSSVYELTQIFKAFVEERFSSVLALKIVVARASRINGTTGDFRDVIRAAFP